MKMALSSMVSKASPSVVPLVLRATSSAGSMHGSIITATVNVEREYVRGIVHTHQFSTVATAKKLLDNSLLKVLRSEIKTANKHDVEKRELPKNPSAFPFTIKDNEGKRTITLVREFPDETIEVEVRKAQVEEMVDEEDESDENSSDEDSSGDDNEDDSNSDEFRGEAIVVQVGIPTNSTTASHAAWDEEGGGVNDDHDDGPVDDGVVEPDHEIEPSISLVVTVSKGNGSCLQFDARAFPGRILVNGLSFNNSSGNFGEDGRPAFKGPDFLDLSEKFQKAIHDYLEMRGLTSSTANYLLEYMIGKEAKEYLQWLKNLKKLIEQ